MQVFFILNVEWNMFEIKNVYANSVDWSWKEHFICAFQLVAGSGGTEASDEATAHPDGDVAKGDGYTEGIPGPVTRLFIIANRGISNLIQDLILRIAQTSERIVNFKARLITSII